MKTWRNDDRRPPAIRGNKKGNRTGGGGKEDDMDIILKVVLAPWHPLLAISPMNARRTFVAVLFHFQQTFTP